MTGGGNHLLAAIAARLNFGALGVVVFFAISGFLIPSSLKGPHGTGTLRYLISRVFRLYPAFLVSVIPSAAAHFWYGGAPFPWSEVFLNFTMLPRLFGGTMANGAYWTLEVEVAFYLLCLLLFLGDILAETFTFAAITLVTFLIFESSQRPFFHGLFNPNLEGASFLFNLNIAVMCWGALCRAWWDGRALNKAAAVVFWGFGGFWVVYEPARMLMSWLEHRPPPIDPNFLCAYGIGLGVFLAALVHGRLGNPLMLWIGRISYSFYLLHGVAIHTIHHFVERHPALGGYPTNLYVLVALLVSLALAQLSFVCIERPGIRLGRRLSDYMLSRTPTVHARWWWSRWRMPVFLMPLLARPATTAMAAEPASLLGELDRPPQ